MTNPFDAAIERLRRSETQGCEPDIEAAIRVLEAAGRVDKSSLEGWLAATRLKLREDIRRSGLIRKAFDDMSALLSALPDKEKK